MFWENYILLIYYGSTKLSRFFCKKSALAREIPGGWIKKKPCGSAMTVPPDEPGGNMAMDARPEIGRKKLP